MGSTRKSELRSRSYWLAIIFCGAVVASHAAQATTFWADWTSLGTDTKSSTGGPNYSYVTSALGTVQDAGTSTTVNLTHSGEVITGLLCCGSTSLSGFTTWTDSGAYYPVASYDHPNIESPATTSADILIHAGYTEESAKIHTITFDKEVSGLVMAIWSLGGQGDAVMLFSEDFEIVATAAHTTSPGSGIVKGSDNSNGYSVLGGNNYGYNGLIQFYGKFGPGRPLQYTITDPEFYFGMNIASTATALSGSGGGGTIVLDDSQIITFANPGSQILGTSPTLSATSTSGLTVTFSSATPTVCTVTPSGTLTLLTTGNCTINADQSGDGTYQAAPQVSQTFAVNQGLTLGGSITGLTASGLVLTDTNGGDATITSGATSFTLPNAINSGTTYSVTVKTQPTGQTCSVSNGSGTATANVTNISVSCSTNTYTLGGSITGLTASGLVLTDTNGGDATITSGATSFTLPNAINSGTTYSVTVKTQPTGQTCSVSNGSGTATANVTNISVSCSTNTYTLGGSITGLTASGLVLTDTNGGDATITSGATSFTLPNAINHGTTYSVTVKTQPTGQTCSVSNGSGTATANVTNVGFTCQEDDPETPPVPVPVLPLWALWILAVGTGFAGIQRLRTAA